MHLRYTNLNNNLGRRKISLRKMVGPVRPQFVLFGSSIVQRSFDPELGAWGAALANLYARQADVILRGYDGWNSRQAVEVLPLVFPEHSAIQPSLVIVYFGSNDSEDPKIIRGSHVPLPEYVENMRKIATHLMNLSGRSRLIFLGVAPVNEEQMNEGSGIYWGRTNKAGQAYSEACIKLCQEMGIKVIDLFAAFRKEKDWETTCFIDGIHLTAAGSKIVANEILNVLKEATEWEPSLYYELMPSEFDELGSLDYKSSPHEFGERCLPYEPEIPWPFNLKTCENLRKIGYIDKPASSGTNIMPMVYRIVLFMLYCFLFVLFLYGLRCHNMKGVF